MTDGPSAMGLIVAIKFMGVIVTIKLMCVIVALYIKTGGLE